MLEVWRALGLPLIYQPKSLRQSRLSPQASNAAVGPAGVFLVISTVVQISAEEIENDRI